MRRKRRSGPASSSPETRQRQHRLSCVPTACISMLGAGECLVDDVEIFSPAARTLSRTPVGERPDGLGVQREPQQIDSRFAGARRHVAARARPGDGDTGINSIALRLAGLCTTTPRRSAPGPLAGWLAGSALPARRVDRVARAHERKTLARPACPTRASSRTPAPRSTT